MTLLWLLAAHHFADVPLQPDWLIRLKSKRLWAIFEHVMVYAGVICLALVLLSYTVTPLVFLYFGLGHFLIDTFFYRVLPVLRNEDKQYWYVYPDQALHYLQIILYLLVV